MGHMGISVGDGSFVHCSSGGVTLQPLQGWYATALAWARRRLAEAGLAVSPQGTVARRCRYRPAPCGGRRLRATATWRTAAASRGARSAPAASRADGAGGGGLGLIVLVVLALLFAGNIIGGSRGKRPARPGRNRPGGPQADAGSRPGTDASGDEGPGVQVRQVRQQGRAGHVDADLPAVREALHARARRDFTSGTVSGCGPASSSTGPFYCPADHKVYLDLSFFRELSRRFRAPSGFAAAYVIAHEIGHHIPSELGIEEEVQRKQQEDSGSANRYSVQLELQADCFAGVWAKSTSIAGCSDPGDVAEGLKAAGAVGDERLGARSREQWTHGSSELRAQWFRTGFDSGKTGNGDTSKVAG